MATIGGRTPSREAALAMIAQVERQAGAIARRYAADDNILDRFSEFRGFIDQLAELHLFIDMVENRLGGFGPDAQAVQVRKLATIRWSALEIEIEVTSRFLDRMVTSGKPWPMGSQKFLRRRLTRLDDIAAFHLAHGAAYDLTLPNANLLQNIRKHVDSQIDNSVPLADFGGAPRPEEPPEAATPDEPVAAIPIPETPPPPPPPPAVPAPDTPKAPDPQPAPRRSAPPPPAPPPPAPSQPAPSKPVPAQPEVMIPGMMMFTPPVSTPATSEASAPESPAARARPAAVALPPDLLVPPSAAAPAPPAAPEPASPLSLEDQLPPLPAEYGEDYVSPKAKAVAKLVEKPAATKPAAKPGAPGTPGLARRDFRLKVRDDADGYHYIEGNGLAVITESCRIANTTIDELARNLELSRPGLVLILNGRDPCSTELLKVLRRFVLRTGGLV
jgi:hypothetical protein